MVNGNVVQPAIRSGLLSDLPRRKLSISWAAASPSPRARVQRSSLASRPANPDPHHHSDHRDPCAASDLNHFRTGAPGSASDGPWKNWTGPASQGPAWGSAHRLTGQTTCPEWHPLPPPDRALEREPGRYKANARSHILAPFLPFSLHPPRRSFKTTLTSQSVSLV